MKVYYNQVTEPIDYPQEVKVVITPEIAKESRYYSHSWECPLATFFNQFFEDKVKTYSYSDVAMMRAKGSKETPGQIHDLVQYQLQDIFAENQYYQVKKGGTFITTAKLVPVTRKVYIKG